MPRLSWICCARGCLIGPPHNHQPSALELSEAVFQFSSSKLQKTRILGSTSAIQSVRIATDELQSDSRVKHREFHDDLGRFRYLIGPLPYILRAQGISAAAEAAGAISSDKHALTEFNRRTEALVPALAEQSTRDCSFSALSTTRLDLLAEPVRMTDEQVRGMADPGRQMPERCSRPTDEAPSCVAMALSDEDFPNSRQDKQQLVQELDSMMRQYNSWLDQRINFDHYSSPLADWRTSTPSRRPSTPESWPPPHGSRNPTSGTCATPSWSPPQTSTSSAGASTGCTSGTGRPPAATGEPSSNASTSPPPSCPPCWTPSSPRSRGTSSSRRMPSGGRPSSPPGRRPAEEKVMRTNQDVEHMTWRNVMFDAAD